MTATTITPTDFLLARIAEDEITSGDMHGVCGIDTGDGECNCGHPARVLAECEAKQRIVEEHRPGPAEHEIWCLTCLSAGSFPCPTLRALALPYADHPDWREEWA